ncbi:CLUMA_CG011312, isoform A [Clunio marinus]|uniref:CLUMA_CG011312, isoform A n=1 Tax=Clunio marinus TaxID=568069 RepID=A0A1J1IEF9_9DIPT|nr:CLUMA_CG011312, isoform A [Clunio marinus]
MMKFPTLWICGLLLLAGGKGVRAWGGLFNRFSPEMLSNMGYGSHGGSSFRAQPLFQGENFIEEEPAIIEEEICYGKRCTANEHCCPGSVCVDVDGVIGNCLFAYGRKLGELCRRDADCESGLVCDVSAVGGASVCRAPMVVAKQYAEECTTSSDCDITRGLCCQLQRRHRQAPRKVCSYFKDPLVCIGTVAMDKILNQEIEHTAGEKRLTSYKRSVK